MKLELGCDYIPHPLQHDGVTVLMHDNRPKVIVLGTPEEAESVVTRVNEHPQAIEMLRDLVSHWRQLPGYAIEQSPGHADTAHNLFMQNFVKEARAVLDRARKGEG